MIGNDKIRISAVSYLNTLPFLYGIKHSGLEELIHFELDFPAICAKKLIENQVDVALIPVAAIPLVNHAEFISDYCIGAVNEVKSVLLFSDVPLEKIESVVLDYQSRTSVNLVKVLANKFWKIAPQWIQASEGFEQSISGKRAAVIIGDRTFSADIKHPFVYDLSAEWYKMTGLPFVFATWVANRKLPDEFVQKFNKALRLGIENRRKAADEFLQSNPGLNIDLYDYYENNISFNFDVEKKKALSLFYRYLAELELVPEKLINKLSF